MLCGGTSSIQNWHEKMIINLVSQIWLKKTGKIQSNPGFQHMHEVSQHVGIVLCLDAWCVMVKKKHWKSLEGFASTEPTWDNLVKLFHTLCQEYISSMHTLSEEQEKAAKEWDQQNENIKLLHQYLLLYEDISHAMNEGDIGHVETLFLPWMWIFWSCGKHKYATEMHQHLENMHFIYPKGLRSD